MPSRAIRRRTLLGVIAGGVVGFATVMGGPVGLVVATLLLCGMLMARRRVLAAGVLVGWGLAIVAVSSIPLANRNPSVFYPADTIAWLVFGVIAVAAGALLWIAALRH